jgi:hypothetical protein
MSYFSIEDFIESGKNLLKIRIIGVHYLLLLRFRVCVLVSCSKVMNTKVLIGMTRMDIGTKQIMGIFVGTIKTGYQTVYG